MIAKETPSAFAPVSYTHLIALASKISCSCAISASAASSSVLFFVSVSRIPTEIHDHPMDDVITEQQWYRPKRTTGGE